VRIEKEKVLKYIEKSFTKKKRLHRQTLKQKLKLVKYKTNKRKMKH